MFKITVVALILALGVIGIMTGIGMLATSQLGTMVIGLALTYGTPAVIYAALCGLGICMEGGLG